MKKIDLMLKVLFLALFANVSFGQTVLPGGLTCEEAVPITTGVWATPSDGFPAGDHWYSFVAPCDGELVVAHAGPNESDKRIHTGVCGSLTEEAFGGWSTASISHSPIDGGETVYVQITDTWDGRAQFSLTYENDDCPQPSSLSFFVSDFETATLAWFGSGLETDFAVIYGPTGFDPAVEGTTVLTDGATSIMLTGLEPLTCYDYYVQPICGAEEACYPEGPVTFCTPAICPAPLAPETVDLTNMDAVFNWTPDGVESEWEVQWGEEGFLIDDPIATDLIDTDPTDTLDGLLMPDVCYDWYVRAVCEVDTGAGLETFYSLWVGETEFCTQPNCLAPTGGSMIASGGLSATLTWDINNDPAESEWNLQYGEPGFTIGEGTTVTNIPTNPFTLEGLMPGTDYCFYVQAVCGDGEDSLSDWWGPYCFTTSIFCEEPSSLFAEGTSETEASLSWTPGDDEEDWTVRWGVDGFDPLTEGTDEDAAVFPAIALTGLTPGETYCYYVKADCGDDADSSSYWAGPFCWTQPALCEVPFAMEMINITNTAAFVNFASPDGDEWNIEWGAPCFEPGMGEEVGMATTDTKPYYITGLEHSTPYWVYVQAVCDGEVSEWTAPFLFGTDIQNDDACEAEELVLDGDPLLRHNFEATTQAGETALVPDAADCFSSDGWCSGDGVDRTVWFKFTAPPSGQVVLSTFDTSTCITNGYTEIAVYTTGDCGIIDNFTLVAANTLAPGATEPPYGSEMTACGLTPGQVYYVMVNPVSYIQTDVHFSVSLSSIEEVSAGLGLSPTICEGSEYNLFDAIAGFSGEDGTWYNPSVAPGNEFPADVVFPMTEGSFPFYYVVSNGCDADTVMTTVTTETGVYAGADGFYTTCNTYDIVLSDHLVGDYDGGGIWEYTGIDPDVALAGGLFTPLAMSPGVYEFMYTVANEYCPTDTAYVTVTLVDCLGDAEEAANNLVVYPNPVVDVLTVQNIEIQGNAVIEVMDIEGRVIISDNVSNLFGNYTIDMTNVESGVYFVRVTAEDAVQKVRVVKQ